MMNHARNWPEPKKKKAVMKRNQVAPEPKRKVTTTQLLEMMKGDSFRRHREEQLVNDGAERLFRKDFSWGEELLKSGLTPATKQRIYHKSRELELEEKKKKALLSLVTNRNKTITRLGLERTRESRPREPQQRFVQRRRTAGEWM